VARRRAAAVRAGGGENIQAPRPRHARLATAAAAVLVAAGLVVSAPLRDPGHELLLLAVGGAGLLVLSAGLASRWSAALAVGVALLGAEQAVRLALGPEALDAWTPLYAGALLLAAELAWWSLEPRVPAWSEPGTGVWRAATVILTCLGGCVVSALVVVASGAPLHGGVGLELVGVLAAAAALAVVAAVARTRSSDGA
jgi:hypothetical protein